MTSARMFAVPISPWRKPMTSSAATASSPITPVNHAPAKDAVIAGAATSRAPKRMLRGDSRSAAVMITIMASGITASA
ncbi:hypothetical protein Nocox_39965 [Nonomuraea coxensis DSM 45129]|uniref:Uncharacterized protein n=2 Tax=Nonomuraea coxensis TaxID=404386 RepID=A0ABX8UDJ9_9ACTN|nr:hypothetical protein Nocox_39965 [Nonomuraea coxensis DSM 45129]